MFYTYTTPIAAMDAIKKHGLDNLDYEIKVVGGGLQPVIICDHIHDAEAVQRRGFNSRLTVEYAAD